MALWANSAINTTATAMLFNQLWDEKSIPMVRKKNGFVYLLLGKKEVGSTPGMPQGWNRMKKVSGLKVEVRLLGKLDTINKTADGIATEGATVTPVNSGDYYGASTFALTHLTQTFGILHSELALIKGKEAKTANFLGEVFDRMMLSYENVLGTDLHATGASTDPTRTTLGSWNWAVSNGLVADSEDTYASYGGIDRSDSANADFRSVVTSSTGDLTLKKIRTNRNLVIANGGTPNCGIAGTTVYGKVQDLVEPYTHVTFDPKMSDFGSDYVGFSNIMFTMDQRAPTQTLGLLEPDSFAWYEQKDGNSNSGVTWDPSRVSLSVVLFENWAQLICLCPSHNGKLTGITS